MTSEHVRLEPDEIKHPRTPNGLRQFQAEQPAELPLGLEDAPLVRLQAQQLVSLLLEINRLTAERRPVELMARIERERKGGLVSMRLDGRVSGTVERKEPRLDARDRTLQGYQRDYMNALNRILDEFQTCIGIEADVLTEVKEATLKQRRDASDLGVDCEDCSRPVACTPADKLLAGMCKPCWNRWNEAGKPDRVKWLKQRKRQREDAT